MDQLLNFLINPIWIQWVFIFFFLRSVYRLVVKDLIVKTGLFKNYNRRYQSKQEQFYESLSENNLAVQLTLLTIVWCRTRSLLCFILAGGGAWFLSIYLIGKPDIRIACNFLEAFIIGVMFEQYTKSILLRRGLEHYSRLSSAS